MEVVYWLDFSTTGQEELRKIFSDLELLSNLPFAREDYCKREIRLFNGAVGMPRELNLYTLIEYPPENTENIPRLKKERILRKFKINGGSLVEVCLIEEDEGRVLKEVVYNPPRKIVV